MKIIVKKYQFLTINGKKNLLMRTQINNKLVGQFYACNNF